MSPSQIPGDLRAVAWVFVAFGILAAIEIIVALTQNRVSINFGVLGIFVGRGLLRVRPGWRTCGLVFIWIALIGAPLFALGSFCTRGVVRFNSHVIGGAEGKIIALLLCGGIFLLHVWEYSVLTRPDVRRLFGLSD
jgi:hypothetical protein